MPYLGLGLHVLVALFFAVHALRSGQDRYWLMILFAFPLLGSVAYGIAVWLPEARHSREGHVVAAGVRRLLDPDRELRAAQDDFDASPTIAHRLRLGDALLAKDRAADAAEHFEKAARGLHDGDPDIQVKLAQAWLASGRAREARELLDDVIRRNPAFRSPVGHLVYARAVAAEGDREKARVEFDTLVGYSGNLDAHAAYAQTLLDWGDLDRAREVCERALAQLRRLPAYNRRMYRDATSRLKRIHGQTRRTAEPA